MSNITYESGSNEAAAIIETAKDAVVATPLDQTAVPHLLLFSKPATSAIEQIDLERHLPQPRRTIGTVQVYDAAGFEAVAKRLGHSAAAPVHVYADEESKALIGIVNDDTASEPGWRDNRLSLALRKTPEWKHWLDHQDYTDQDAFAQAIDLGLKEIISPPQADMLEIAQQFNATVGSKVKVGGKLTNGARQLVYEETVDAAAGIVAIPDEFTLKVAPFIGSAEVEVVAKLRYKVRGPNLQIGYFLVRPHEVERAAFLSVVAAVETGLETTAVRGVAPSAR